MRLFSVWGIQARNSARTDRAGLETKLAIYGAGFLCVCAIGTLGCGMAAVPQPPSLQLPKPIRDLAAARVGDRVDLQWNTPDENTDRLRIRGPVKLQICRQMDAAPCESVATVFSAPGKPAAYIDSLPASLTTGPLHAITYEISGINKHGRSAGPSNAAVALAGAVPPPVQDLSATVVERGVVLHWQSIGDLQPDTSIELRRTLLSETNSGSNKPPGLPPVPEPTEQTLRILFERGKGDTGKALDNNIIFNRKYRYAAARIVRLKVETKWIEAASAPSAPVDVFTKDRFPPATPSGLTVVPIAAEMNGGEAEIDVSWSANTEPDFAQYFVYRRNVSSGQAAAERILPENSTNPIVAPAFRDPHVLPGSTYAYSVIAVDSSGNKSARSPEVVVTVPGS
jgi:hypothetical protein